MVFVPVGGGSSTSAIYILQNIPLIPIIGSVLRTWHPIYTLFLAASLDPHCAELLSYETAPLIPLYSVSIFLLLVTSQMANIPVCALGPSSTPGDARCNVYLLPVDSISDLHSIPLDTGTPQEEEGECDPQSTGFVQ